MVLVLNIDILPTSCDSSFALDKKLVLLLGNFLVAGRSCFQVEIKESRMRQLKGKTAKETSKMKRERKMENMENKSSALYIVLPTLAVVIFLIVSYVYSKTNKQKAGL